MTEKIDWQPWMVAKCMHVYGFAVPFVAGQKEKVEKVTVLNGAVWLHFGKLGWWHADRFKPVYRVKARGVQVPHAFNRQEHWDMLLAAVPGRCATVSA